MKLQLEMIMLELNRFQVYYYGTRYFKRKLTHEEFEILAEMWLEDFKDMNAYMFGSSCQLHRTAADYFPTADDILFCYDCVLRDRREKIRLVPEQTTTGQKSSSKI